MFVFLSTISRQTAGQFTPNFACGRTLIPNVSSPLLGVGGPRRAEKKEMKFLLLWESMGNFCILAVFERCLSNACTVARIHTKYYLCRDNVCRRAPSLCGAHRPLGDGCRGVSGSGSQVSEISSDLRYGLPTSLGQCIYMSHGLTNELLVT